MLDSGHCMYVLLISLNFLKEVLFTREYREERKREWTSNLVPGLRQRAWNYGGKFYKVKVFRTLGIVHREHVTGQ